MTFSGKGAPTKGICTETQKKMLAIKRSYMKQLNVSQGMYICIYEML
jgi:hypothetical protein